MNRARVVSIAVVLFAAAFAIAQSESKMKSTSKKTSAAKTHQPIVMNESEVKWADAPPELQPGAKIAVLEGDPGKAGPYTLRLKAPDGYKIQPHWHPTDEHVTIVAGTFHVGMGDKFDQSKGVVLGKGAYASMPARMHHYAWAERETEVQVHGNGPFKIIYVNAADDPSKAANK